MATEAARLEGKKNFLTGKNKKTDLTLTGLLMEGLGESNERHPIFFGVRPAIQI